MKQMLSLFLLSLFLSVFAYEKIDIYSDNLSLIDITKDDAKDLVTVSSETRIAVSYKSSFLSHFSLPDGLKEFQFSITNHEMNYGRYILETPFDGVHIAITYDRKRSLEGLCDIFSKTLPCFNVKECNMETDHPVATIDLSDVFWTPASMVPYSITKPTTILGDEWVTVANIFIPKEFVNLTNYHSSQCISSIYHHNNLFKPESSWYPSTDNADLRYISFKIRNGRDQELVIEDAHIVDSPLIIPEITKISAYSSSVDVIFHKYGDNGKFDRFTANGKKILFPIREFPFFTGDVKLSLNGEQLTIDGFVYARDGTYNPYIEIYDSRVGVGVIMPKGTYIDLAEMQLMFDSKKLPVYVSYVSNVNTDLTYEESSTQMVVFMIESTIYPLPPTLNFNFTIPVHLRNTMLEEDVNVVIPPPVFFACTPVRDTSIKNSKPTWWRLAIPECNSIEVTLPKIEASRRMKEDMIYNGLSILCLLIMIGMTIRFIFTQ